MTGEKAIVFWLTAIAAAGWITVGILVLSGENPNVRVIAVDEDSERWKRQAGKAYTELLKLRGGTGSTTALIPNGPHMDCSANTTTKSVQTVSECEDGIIYPPKDY